MAGLWVSSSSYPSQFKRRACWSFENRLSRTATNPTTLWDSIRQRRSYRTIYAKPRWCNRGFSTCFSCRTCQVCIRKELSCFDGKTNGNFDWRCRSTLFNCSQNRENFDDALRAESFPLHGVCCGSSCNVKYWYNPARRLTNVFCLYGSFCWRTYGKNIK